MDANDAFVRPEPAGEGKLLLSLHAVQVRSSGFTTHLAEGGPAQMVQPCRPVTLGDAVTLSDAVTMSDG
ncbi:MAG: hypothetical protein M3063_08560 [Actinomycetota bacterium]|nr:hypothetical protein [Actinomycetota bacterium]